MATKVAKFTQNCEGAKYLKEQFDNFSADNNSGINNHFSKPGEIREVYDKHPIFHQYSKDAFVINFRNHARNFATSEYKSRKPKARLQGKFNFFVFNSMGFL